MTMQRTLTLIGIAGLGLTSLVACGSDDATSSDTSVEAPPESVADTIQDTVLDTTATTDTTDTTEGAPPPDATAPPETDPPPPTTEVVEPPAPEPGQLELGLVDCVQFAMVAPVDADAARSLVPDDVEVLLDEAGMATFTQVSKTCDDMTVDGASQGTGHFDTQWITIAGPTEQREYPDFAGYFVLPTDYLYPINFAVRQRCGAGRGVCVRRADGAGRPADGSARPGRLDRGGEWPRRRVHVERRQCHRRRHQRLLRPCARAGRRRARLPLRHRVPLHPRLGAGAGIAEPAAGSALFEAFGAEIVGEGYGVELTCDVTIDRTMQVTVTEDVDYTETRQLDVYAPSMGSDWPVVVYFHGGDADPGTRKTVVEAAALAEQRPRRVRPVVALGRAGRRIRGHGVRGRIRPGEGRRVRRRRRTHDAQRLLDGRLHRCRSTR